METNRTSSFPAVETDPTLIHRPNTGYQAAQIAFGITAFSTGVCVLLWLMGSTGLALFSTAMLAVQFFTSGMLLRSARKQSNQRAAEYRLNNPNVELFHGP